MNETIITNTAADANVATVLRAGGEHVENYQYTGQMRIDAEDNYAKTANQLTNQQAAANNQTAGRQRDLATGGVELGYRQQVEGVNQTYQLNLEANQLSFARALKATESLQASGLKAVKLKQMPENKSCRHRPENARSDGGSFYLRQAENSYVGQYV